MSAKFNTSSLHAEDLNRNAGDVHGAAHKDIAIPVPGKHDCCHLPDITGLRAQIIGKSKNGDLISLTLNPL